MSDLPRLSTGILRQICSTLPGSSALTFLLVCRSINRACDDWTVWRAIIRDGAQYPAGIALAEAGNHEVWKRYVKAAVKAARTQRHWGTEDFSRWLPQVAALGDADIWQSAVPFLEQLCSAILHNVTAVPHPTLDVLDLATRSDTASTHAWRLAQASAFCLTMRSLSISTVPKADDGVMELLKRPDFVSLDQQLAMPSEDWERHMTTQHALANRAVGCACAMICFDRARRNATSQPAIGLASPPTNRTIPIKQLMDLPLPFSTYNLKQFTKCHLPKMATLAFFTDSEWTGYMTSSGSPEYPISVHGIGPPHIDGFDSVTGETPSLGDFPLANTSSL